MTRVIFIFCLFFMLCSLVQAKGDKWHYANIQTLGFPLTINFDPQLFVSEILIEIEDSWFHDKKFKHALDIEITGINGGFERHGTDRIEVTDTTVFSTDGQVANTVVHWTADTVGRNVNEVYTVCVQTLIKKKRGEKEHKRKGYELIGTKKCNSFGPF